MSFKKIMFCMWEEKLQSRKKKCFCSVSHVKNISKETFPTWFHTFFSQNFFELKKEEEEKKLWVFSVLEKKNISQVNISTNKNNNKKKTATKQHMKKESTIFKPSSSRPVSSLRCFVELSSRVIKLFLSP